MAAIKIVARVSDCILEFFITTIPKLLFLNTLVHLSDSSKNKNHLEIKHKESDSDYFRIGQSRTIMIIDGHFI